MLYAYKLIVSGRRLGTNWSCLGTMEKFSEGETSASPRKRLQLAQARKRTQNLCRPAEEVRKQARPLPRMGKGRV